jgi:pyruvate/2-oxoglutarate dehydrogenase complex dihydrolipoamide dehydrogenase (E3) component
MAGRSSTDVLRGEPVSKTYDAIIIGTGQAGPALCGRLAAAGMRVAIIERKNFGGTCVNMGCTPTKAMVASARAAYMVRRAADFGVVIDGPVGVDMKKVMARKDEIVNKSSGGIEKWLKGLEAATVYEGHGRFEGPHAVRVDSQVLEAERIFIDVGGRALVPHLPGIEVTDHMTNADIMELEYVPDHLVIVGGGYVGLEFGQMFRRFGSRVTIVEKGPRVIKRDDEEVSEAVREILEIEGIDIRLNAECIRVKQRGENVYVGIQCDEPEKEIEGTHLLFAVGRRPVDDTLQTNVPGVWALGDCNGKGAFTHTAYNDFEIVAANLLDDDHRRVSDRIPTYGLFVDPPLGRVGMTEQEVRASGKKALVARRPMTRVSRAVEKGETQGFMKVLVDAETKHILGAAILGVGGDEVVHLITDIMYAKAPYTVIQRAVHAHPTVAELVPTLLADLGPLQ